MRTKINTDGQKQLSFIEAARRAQIIECAIKTIATLGYTQASLAQIAKEAGISKGVISYHFMDKETLLEQVVTAIYAAGADFMTPKIIAQPTATQMLQTYIQTNLEYIGSHRLEMIAVAEIMLNLRSRDGKLRFDFAEEKPVLAALEAILHKGQKDGEFRKFDTQVMAITIRRAIDAVPPVLMATPDLDLEAYIRELVTLFELSTRHE